MRVQSVLFAPPCRRQLLQPVFPALGAGYARLRPVGGGVWHTPVWGAGRASASPLNTASVCGRRGQGLGRGLSGGAAGPIPFHAFGRACRFNSWYRLRPTCRAPEKSKDIAACARSFRVRQFAWLIEAPRRSSAIGTEVSAERHKSDCCSTAGEDQQGLRLCGLEGRRSMQ